MSAGAQKNSDAEGFRLLRPIQPAMLRGRAGGVAGRNEETRQCRRGSNVSQMRERDVGNETFWNWRGYAPGFNQSRASARWAGKIQ
jgi:hypothetical protein